MAAWVGQTTTEGLADSYVQERMAVSNAARAGHWPDLLELLDLPRMRPNLWHLDDPTLMTPLHEAARLGAPAFVVRDLLHRGAWRRLPDRLGRTPQALAEKGSHEGLVGLLAPPAPAFEMTDEELAALQQHLHTVMRERAGALIEKFRLRLPELVVLNELDPAELEIPIPRMLGGFWCTLQNEADGPVLNVKSAGRSVTGWGRRWRITPAGAEEIERGLG